MVYLCMYLLYISDTSLRMTYGLDVITYVL